MSTIGHNYSSRQPVNPRFMPRCSTCKDSNSLIDPLTQEGRLAKDLGNGSYQCLRCQTKEIEDIHLKLDPHSEKAQQILYKRIREMEEGPLKQDEMRYLQSLQPKKFKVIVKRKFQKQQAQKGVNQNQKQQPKNSKLRITVKKKFPQQKQQPHTYRRGWR